MNCKSSNAYVSPIPRRRYLVPKVGTERTRKKEGNTKKCTCSLFISSSIPARCFCVAKGFMYMYMYQKNEKKEGDCLSTSSSPPPSSSSSIHFSTYTQTNHKQIPPPIFSFSFSLPKSFMKKNNANKTDVRVIYILHKDPSFFVHTHRVRCRKSGSRDVAGTCTCYVLGKLRVRSVGLGETGDRM